MGDVDRRENRLGMQPATEVNSARPSHPVNARVGLMSSLPAKLGRKQAPRRIRGLTV